jgi:C4-dicarboxylate transporter DctM subunit
VTTFLVLVALLCLLFVAGFPVAFSLGIAGFVGLLVTDQSLKIVGEIVFASVDNFVLLAIPLFIFMSRLLLKTGMAEDIFAVMDVFLRHRPGGLAVAAVFCCAFFATISGSSVTNAAAVGIIAIPALIQRGYPPRFVAGLIAAGGTLGILIPPSIPFIVYGAITGESVGKLFVAGVIPGILMALALAGYAMFASWAHGYGRREAAAPWSERLAALRRASWALTLPVAILGGIYSGVFTPTEAAAIGVLLSVLAGCLRYRTLDWAATWAAARETVQIAAMLLAIIAGAKLFGHVATTMQIPQGFSDWIVGTGVGKTGFLIGVMLALILLGDFLDPISIILIVVPILHPVLKTFGIDPIWFGVLLVINMELANITPPVGLNLFVIQGIQRDLTFADVLRGTFPFMVVITVGLGAVLVWPELALWLTRHVQ